MNRIISDVLGRVPTRKKLRQPLKVHWCRVALDFHGEASRFRRPDLQARVLGCFPHGGPVGSIDGLCAMTPPALGLLPGTRLASTYFPPRCGPLQDGPHDPSHPGQIFLAYSRFSHLLKRNKTWGTSNPRPGRHLRRRPHHQLGTTLQAHRHTRLTRTSPPADKNRPVRVSIMRVLGDFRFQCDVLF